MKRFHTGVNQYVRRDLPGYIIHNKHPGKGVGYVGIGIGTDKIEKSLAVFSRVFFHDLVRVYHVKEEVTKELLGIMERLFCVFELYSQSQQERSELITRNNDLNFGHTGGVTTTLWVGVCTPEWGLLIYLRV